MKNQINRELVEGLNESSNQSFAENINDTINNLIGQVVEDISEKSPFVKPSKCVLLPVNEVYLGAFSQLSQYSYFLGIENTQMEFNSKLKKNWWKFAWREFKASWRIGRKKKYKKEKETKKKSVDSIERYKISDFRHDVVLNLANYISPTSIIYEYQNHISVVGKEDFGSNVRINIYICSYDSKTNEFKIFKPNKNKFYPYSFGRRFENLDLKVKECGEMFVNMAKILNSIYSKTYNQIPNQILVESLLFNCPKVLFNKKDVYKTFVNVANYIRLKNPKSFVSICDSSKGIFDEPLIIAKNSQVDFGKIINMLDEYKF